MSEKALQMLQTNIYCVAAATWVKHQAGSRTEVTQKHLKEAMLKFYKELETQGQQQKRTAAQAAADGAGTPAKASADTREAL